MPKDSVNKYLYPFPADTSIRHCIPVPYAKIPFI